VTVAARWLAPFASRRMLTLAALGFSSGLPLLVTGSLLAAVLTDARLDPQTITALASVGLPYTLKFAWAPLLDRYPLPVLGRRRGWILALQLALAGTIALLGGLDPRADLDTVIAVAVAVAALSASQDVVIDAYAAEVLDGPQRAAGSAAYVAGYRVALLVTGTVALGLGDTLRWPVIFAGLAAVMALCTVATLLAEEPPMRGAPPASLAAAAWRPLAELFGRGDTRRARLAAAGALLGFVALYKFGDALAGTATTLFYRRELGFSWAEIAGLSKALGFAGTLLGAAAAGVLAPRLGVRRALLTFGAAQAGTNLLLAALALHGPSYPLLGTAIFVDSAANALGTGAFVAFLMSQTRPQLAATQYALFTGLSTIGARVFGFVAGELIGAVGYAGFFALTAAMAAPGLLLVAALPTRDLRDPPPG
jgi:PAT family beta-lactamase induction signal transducer AmpG